MEALAALEPSEASVSVTLLYLELLSAECNENGGVALTQKSPQRVILVTL